MMEGGPSIEGSTPYIPLPLEHIVGVTGSGVTEDSTEITAPGDSEAALAESEPLVAPEVVQEHVARALGVVVETSGLIGQLDDMRARAVEDRERALDHAVDQLLSMGSRPIDLGDAKEQTIVDLTDYLLERGNALKLQPDDLDTRAHMKRVGDALKKAFGPDVSHQDLTRHLIDASYDRIERLGPGKYDRGSLARVLIDVCEVWQRDAYRLSKRMYRPEYET